MDEDQSHTPLALIRQLATDSEEALAGIIALCKPGLLQFLSIYTPDEGMAQEVFLDVMQTLWEKRKWVSRLDNPYTWLTKVAKNKVINRLRHNTLDQIVGLEKAFLLPDTTDTGSDLNATDLYHFIMTSANKLTAREKEVFQLRVRYGWNTKAIANRLQVSESTVRSQLQNSLRKIREALSWFQRMIIF